MQNKKPRKGFQYFQQTPKPYQGDVVLVKEDQVVVFLFNSINVLIIALHLL